MADPGRADYGQQVQFQGERLRALVENARAESVSDDHAVRVTVGPGGTVVDIEVTSRAMGRSGDEIGELIVAEIKKANRQLTAELNGQMAEILGMQQAAEVADAVDDLGFPSVEEIRREREAIHEQRAEMKREMGL
ncbi:YbaB/EbfC family nucleoid-associated protein [Phytomonospora endophytica]|uniref:DNA-binding protein YbaB n=1 Tax=Phytomonospora endophytica TaxID=714109 RepID=A0A841FJP5_9ACTN|nr:YbaB/EbfC family nucleoid-associated protein [Phytomonospora endophytica]MBB6032859.1 DNA-binding protein YbaB [Phytomonospora endophytica]GIG65085.1 hypothetical protein Pen01_13800 [Phytomonospora endophytica]